MVEIITRRSFLSKGIAGISLAATAPHFLSLSSRAFAGEGDSDRILVVVQLSGGNDGLSTVIPYADPAYRAARRQTARRENEVLKLSESVGLHPDMKRWHAMFQEGHLAIVQGASYPNPNRSHFSSMDVWHTGDLRGRGRDTGWIGRAVDACCPDVKDPNLVVNIGQSIPYALEAKVHKPVSFSDPNAYRWAGNPNDKAEFEELNGPVTAKEQVKWLHRVAVDARTSSAKIRAAAAGYRPQAKYGTQGRAGALANQLRTVAALIQAGIGTRVYYVSFGGFDTHNNQRNRHDNLMRQLDGALGAFHEDLQKQGLAKRVLVMSFSEFGRRVVENASAGTDHGVAGPMFLIGGGVKGGLHGKHPSLDDLDRGDLKMTVDFRSVYATVLEDWMQFDSTKVLPKRFPKLPLL